MPTNREIMYVFRAKDAAKGVLKGMGSNFKTLATNVKKAKETTTKLKRETDKLRQSSERVKKLDKDYKKLTGQINKARSAQRKFASGMAALGVGVGGGFVLRDALSTYANFEQSMAQVGAVSNATAAEFKLLNDTAKLLGSTTEFTGRQAASGLEFLVRAGFSATEAVKSLPATLDLATGAGIDLGRSADIVSNIMSTFGKRAEDTAEITDVLATVNSSANTNVLQLAEAMKYAGPIANGFGVSVNETAAAIGVLGDSGLQGSLAGTGVRMALIDAKMLSTGNHTARAQKAFDALKIPKENIDPEKVGLNGMIGALKEAGATMEDLVTIFGARAAPSVAVLINGYDKLGTLTQATADNVGESARQAAVMRDTLLGDWKALRSAIEGAYIAIGEVTGGSLRTMVQFMTSVVQALQGATITFDKFTESANATAAALKVLGPIIGVLLVARLVTLIGFVAKLALGFRGAAGASGVLAMALKKLPFVALVALAIEFWKEWQKLLKVVGGTKAVVDAMAAAWAQGMTNMSNTATIWGNNFKIIVAEVANWFDSKMASMGESLNGLLGGIDKLSFGKTNLAGDNAARTAGTRGSISERTANIANMKAENEKLRSEMKSIVTAGFDSLVEEGVANAKTAIAADKANTLTTKTAQYRQYANRGDGTAPLVIPDDLGVDDGTGTGTGGGGGASTAALSDKRDIVKDITAQYREQLELAGFAGRELELQKVIQSAKKQAQQEGIELSKEELLLLREQANLAMEMVQSQEMVQGYTDLVTGSLSDGLKSALDNGRLDMGAFIGDMGQKLRNMAIDNFINILMNGGGGGGGGLMNMIMGAFSGGGGGGGIGGFFSSLFGFADGGIMTNQGSVPLKKYSGGGIANSPQLAMFGEGSVPEAYVPVPSGKIPVEMNGSGGGGTVVNVSMTVMAKDADSFNKSKGQIASDMGREINRHVKRNS